MKKDLAIITVVFAVVSLTFYFFAKYTRAGTDSLYRAWDGPSYVIAAQSLYVPELAVSYNSIQSPEIRADFTFLPAHFPLYPWLIRMLSFLGYYQAMLLLSLGFSWLFLLVFYSFAKLLSVPRPLLLTLPLILLTPRWFIISHTGSSEPLFLFALTLSLYYFYKNQTWSSAIMAAVAQLTRPQGSLLGLAYLVIALVELWRSHSLQAVVKRYYPYLLVPFTLFLVFMYYRHQTGNFWAFFSAISIFHHFQFRLLPSFDMGSPNIETFWLEANVYVFFLALYSILKKLFSRHWQLGIVGLVFYLPLLFLSHTDISRYSLPLLPIMFLSFAPIISTPIFNLATYLTLPAIFRYATTFILYNRAP